MAIVAIADVPVRVRSNSASVTQMATHRFPELDATVRHEADLDVRVVSAPLVGAPDRLAWEIRDGRELHLALPNLRVVIDLDRASGTMHLVDSTLAEGSEAWRVIEGMLFSVINRRDRHPLHAATLRAGDRSLVLHGPSGVGKSTLMWEAHRAGMEVLSDDATRVQLSPELRVWGDGAPPRILLLDDVRDRYAELRGLPAQAMGADNEPKVIVRLNPDSDWMPYGRNPRVVLLSRSGAERLAVIRATSEEIFSALMSAEEAEMDLSPGNRERAFRALSEPGGYRMDLSMRATDAIPALRELLEPRS